MTEIALPSFRPEPRCRVCRSDAICQLVNRLLASGSSYAQIVRAVVVGGEEAVSLDSVRNHATRHFPLQNTAQAMYREIVERRAVQNGIDFVEGLVTALTPLAFMETLMARAFDRLVQPETEVSIETGFKAAEKLHAVAGSRDPGMDQARMMAEMDSVIRAVRSVVPPHMWTDIAAALKSPQLDPLESEPSASKGIFDQGSVGKDEPFDPGDDGDDCDDDF